MIAFLERWLRIRVLRAELRDIDKEEQQAKDSLARVNWRRQVRVQELEKLGAKP